MKSTYTNIEELPLTLNAREAAEVLRISKSKVYELARTESFPAIRIGTRVKQLTPTYLQQLYAALLTKGRVERPESENQPKGLSIKTVRNIHTIIRQLVKRL